MDYKRSEVRKHFENDKFNRENAEEWLETVGISGEDATNILDNLFKDSKSYDSSTKFLRDLAKHIPSDSESSKSEASGSSELHDDDLNDVFNVRRNASQPCGSGGNHNSSGNHNSGGSHDSTASHSSSDGNTNSNNSSSSGIAEPVTGDNTNFSQNGDVGIVGMTSTDRDSNKLKYPEGVQAGDNAVLTMSYSGDHGTPDIKQLEADGWEVKFNKGAENSDKDFKDGETDLATMIATKKLTGNESGRDFEIPGGDVSGQMAVIRGGNIDMESMNGIAHDGDGDNTKIASNNTEAPYYLYVMSSDDPPVYEQSNLQGIDAEYFGAAPNGDDGGGAFISRSGSGGNIAVNSYSPQGRNDHSLSFAIRPTA